MSPVILLSFLLIYFGVLIGVAYWTSDEKSDNSSFFIANRNSKWYVVAFGMIGTALSGVTFISVPGAVGATGFGYFQFVLGNAVGYVLVAYLLLPIYYKMNLLSIYTYLERRLGYYSYKTGAFIFLISRAIGSAFRLYLVAIILQRFIFDAWNLPFFLTVTICLLLIWVYTHKGGLKTILITDLLQTVFLVISVILSICFIADGLGLSILQVGEVVKESGYAKIFYWGDFLEEKQHFVKQFFGGVFVTLAMFGLDQDLMQKNISMKTVGEAQKNMMTFMLVFVVINIFFLSVGAMLYIYSAKIGLNIDSLPTLDYLFPEIALNHLPLLPGIIFMMGLTAATFATTDSALTALTTSFCVDFLNFQKKININSPKLIRARGFVHFGFSLLILLIVLVFKIINDESVVVAIFIAAGYTYGPLLGLFVFGIFSKRNVRDKWIPYICVISPCMVYVLKVYMEHLVGYSMSFELIILNAFLTWLMIMVISKTRKMNEEGFLR